MSETPYVIRSELKRMLESLQERVWSVSDDEIVGLALGTGTLSARVEIAGPFGANKFHLSCKVQRDT